MNFSNKKIAKFFNYTLIVVFLVLISAPFIGTLYGMEEKINNLDNSEKRTLAKKPEININNFDFGDYADEMENFINDNFGFRSIMVRWNQLLHVKWLHTAPITKWLAEKGERIQSDVVIGKDGWYYYAKDRAMDDYRGLIQLSEKQLEDMKVKLENNQRWLNELGIEMVVFIAPNKSSIYPEYIPDNYNKVGDQTRLDQFKDYMSVNSDVKLIDPRVRLLNAKKDNLLYNITGTHWNEYGGFIAYGQLIEYLGNLFPVIEVPSLSDYNITIETQGGKDLAIMMSIQDYVQEQFVKVRPKNGFQAVNDELLFDDPNPNYSMDLVAKKIDDENLPKAVIFRDSFMNVVEPYLSEHFRRSSYVWTYDILPHVIEIEKPDIVIYEFVERNLEEALLRFLTIVK
ncbi:MAG: hypothetical protein Q8P20_00035 [bacterium]|nr:hypothetical protein [bacterium]